MKVYHMNGAGNDFMVMDGRGLAPDYEALARSLCAITHADGFMAVDDSGIGDFKLHFYNSDGSRGEMCGNGARCICRFANELGIAGEAMTVETDAGIVPGWHLQGEQYRVKLNPPGVLDLNRMGEVAYVELGCPGVPHAVAEYDGDPWADADALRERMRRLRFDPAFPKGANVNFYSWIGPGEVRILTFERGVEDFTLACGTGCGSTAAVLNRKGLLPGGVLTAHNRGGTLRIVVSGDPDAPELALEGPTQITEILEVPESVFIPLSADKLVHFIKEETYMETYEEKQEATEQAQPVTEEAPIPEEAPQTDQPQAEETGAEEPKVENTQYSDTSKQLRDLERMIGSAFKDLSESLGNAASWVKKTVDEKVDAAKQSREKEEDPFTKIEKLSHLRDIGAITLEEFNNKKAELLKKI